MRRVVAMVVVLGIVLTACDSSAGSADTSARSLAPRLHDAGVCTTKPRRSTPEQAEMMRPAGLTNTWMCDAPSPTNDAHGGIEVGLWAGRTSADRRRVVRKMNGLFQGFCRTVTGFTSGKSTDTPTGTATSDPQIRRTVTPAAIETYVEGDTWLAVAGINARLKRVASALNGQAVTKHCS